MDIIEAGFPVVSEGEKNGAIQEEEREMIASIFELHDVEVAAIMTPRTDMVCIEADASLDELRSLANRCGFSRIPVFEGTRDNIIPRHVELTGTLRALSQETYDWLKEEVRRALGVVRALGGDVRVEFSTNYAVLHNDPDLTDFVTQVAQDLLGTDAVLPARPVMGGEDFGVLAQEAPGCYIRLGGGFPGQPLRNHHDAHFDIDESALPIGAAILAETALRYLER